MLTNFVMNRVNKGRGRGQYARSRPSGVHDPGVTPGEQPQLNPEEMRLRAARRRDPEVSDVGGHTTEYEEIERRFMSMRGGVVPTSVHQLPFTREAGFIAHNKIFQTGVSQQLPEATPSSFFASPKDYQSNAGATKRLRDDLDSWSKAPKPWMSETDQVRGAGSRELMPGPPAHAVEPPKELMPAPEARPMPAAEGAGTIDWEPTQWAGKSKVRGRKRPIPGQMGFPESMGFPGG